MRTMLASLSGLAVALLLSGCAGTTSTETVPAAPTGESATLPENPFSEGEGPIDVSGITLDDEQKGFIEKLPEEDRALAYEQKICPSTKEPLGSMGVPVKVDVKGQPVFLCCAGCKEDVEKNPDAVLAALGKTPAESAEAIETPAPEAN